MANILAAARLDAEHNAEKNESPTVHHVGIIIYGATGRMATNQHLIRSIKAIIDDGGLPVPSKASQTSIIMPRPVLVGRNAQKLRAVCKLAGLPESQNTTDLDAALEDPNNQIFFDAGMTSMRYDVLKKAIAKGKHVYCEKPSASTLDQAMELCQLAETANVKHGVVQDKLFLPGLVKLRNLIKSGFFGDILSVRGEFGYWVFPGVDAGEVPQRPSWNYKVEDGGGIIDDMVCHWRYVISNLFGEIRSVSCTGATHVKTRVDEMGETYNCTADDACYATFQLVNDVLVHFNSSWCTRVRRDDLLTIQVDGTKGSAVAGLREVWVQHGSVTPRPVWNPDIESKIDYREGWQKVPDNDTEAKDGNAFRKQWEMFLRHVVADELWEYGLMEGAKGLQLTEAAKKSWKERRWVDLEKL
jgi:predicted dehydrogenase